MERLVSQTYRLSKCIMGCDIWGENKIGGPIISKYVPDEFVRLQNYIYPCSSCNIHSPQHSVFSQWSNFLYILFTLICSFFMFAYVHAKEIIICPGYDAVVHFVYSDAHNIRHWRKYSKRVNVAILIEQRE
jgi:hypothetical protein